MAGAGRRCGRLMFLGTGCSTGTPTLRCIMQREERACAVCDDAVANPLSKNARGTPSAVVTTPDGGTVLIDCGPTFKQNAMRLFPRHGVRKIDAVLLTHDHYDASCAINELREVQAARCPPGTWKIDHTLPIYGNARALATAQRQFPYLFAGEFETLTGKFKAIEISTGVAFTPPDIGPHAVMPLEVEHGRDYMSFAYSFGDTHDDRVVYISDVSRVPDATMAHLTARGIGTLIVDAVADFERPSHFSLAQALQLIQHLRPQRAYLVGMSCHLDHDATTAALANMANLPCPVELAYDGLALDFPW